MSLVELVRFEEDQVSTQIEYIHGCPVHRLRGRLLPLVMLREVLALENERPTSEKSEDRSGVVNIIVVQTEAGESGDEAGVAREGKETPSTGWISVSWNGGNDPRNR